MATGCRTSVSVVHEYAARKKLTPNYLLVEQYHSSYQPYFKYRLQMACYQTEGEGRSKRFAKQDAATKMIDILGLGEELNGSSKNGDGVTTRNYIGLLLEYCLKHRHTEPVYDIIDEFGPPHARQFTAQCTVRHLTTTHRSGTKKQARQLAAKEMMENLIAQDEVHNIPIVVQKTPREVREKWAQVSVLSTFRNAPVNSYSNSHLAYECLLNVSPTLRQFAMERKRSFECNDLAIITREIRGRIKVDTIHRDDNKISTLIQVFSQYYNMPLCGMGENEEKAVQDLMIGLMDLIA